MEFKKTFLNVHVASELALRVLFTILYRILALIPPYKRIMLENEIDQYKYPSGPSLVSMNVEWVIVLGIPIITIVCYYAYTRNLKDVRDSFLGLSLSYGMTVFITNVLKVIVGRPRPDFYWQCLPNANLVCTGDENSVNHAHRSFPSGHASIAFATMIFVSMFAAGKFNIFNEKGRGNGWKLWLCSLPILIAFFISFSRVWDYHHHWEDVIFGGVIGTVSSIVCYYQYYPSLSSKVDYYTGIADEPDKRFLQIDV